MTTQLSPANRSIANIEDFITAVGAAAKTAEAHTEPGSQGGPTTHPSKAVDDNTQNATTGARAKENEKDVKEMEGKPSVDSTAQASAKSAEEAAGTPGTAADDQIQIGTKKGPTGTDVPATKPGKDDPGSTHPDRTDNNELNGGKYAADLAKMDFSTLAKLAGDLGNQICAAITVDATDAGRQAVAPAAPAKTAAAPAPAPAIDPALAQAAGWEMAALITGNFDKNAADRMVHHCVVETIKTADDDATRLATYMISYDQAQKQAALSKHADPTGGPQGGAPDPSAAGGPPAGPDASAGAGGPPGAGGDDDAMLAQLLAKLQEMGITPEELEQLMAQEGGPQGGAGPGGAGPGGPGPGGPPGMTPPGAGPMPGAGGPPGMQVAAADKNATAAMANVIRELVSRSRAKAAAAVR